MLIESTSETRATEAEGDRIVSASAGVSWKPWWVERVVMVWAGVITITTLRLRP